MPEAGRSWGRSFDPDRLAALELAIWKAYYRRQGLRLFGLVVRLNHEQAGASWIRATLAASRHARAARGFGTATGEYDHFLPDIVAGYRALGVPSSVDVEELGRRELRWWVVRREIGLAAGDAAGQAIAAVYSTLYGLPETEVAEAGRLRGQAAEARDRGAAADPDGPAGLGLSYWPEVGRLLRASYRNLAAAVTSAGDRAGAPDAGGISGASASPGAASVANEYAFETTWRLAATPADIVDVLGDAAALARWWPSVYLEVTVREPGDDQGIGRVVDLYTKGWLPYTLRWQFRVTDSHPLGFALEASGDFVGRGVWTFDPELGPDEPSGPRTRVVYDWRIVAEKGVLKRFSFLLKPLFSANHRWAMARGEESIRLEIARRHAAGDPAVLAAIPAPPGPTFPHNRRRRS